MTRRMLVVGLGSLLFLLVAPAQAAGTAAATSILDSPVVDGQWSWASGSEHVADWEDYGVYGTKGVAAPGNFPGAREDSVSWTDAGGNLWLFGGRIRWGFSGANRNDLWKWDGAEWTWVSGSDEKDHSGTYGTKGVAAPLNVPGARCGSVSWIDANGIFWLFGGYGQAGGNDGDLNDLWKWDGTNWTWVSGSNGRGQYGTYGTKGIAASGNVPGARSGSVSWTDVTGKLWLFGGYGNASAASGTGYLNDLWRWDGTNWTWISGSDWAGQMGTYGTKGVAATGNVPGGRTGAVAWTDTIGHLWLFGGRGRSAAALGTLNDLWKWDGTSWTWVSGSSGADQGGSYGATGVPAPANVPGARSTSVSWTDASGSLWLFGGYGRDGVNHDGYLGDLWKWDGTNWTWMSGPNIANQPGTYGTKGVPAAGNAPGGRSDSISWADASGGRWLFGGKGYTGTDLERFNDLWRWDGTNWTWVSGSNKKSRYGVYGTKGVAAPGNLPGARYASVSWKDASGDLWLFGGYGYAANGQGWLNDLWKWDGTNWTWVSGSDTPGHFGTYGAKGVAAAGNVPGARGAPVSWRDANGNLWLFGGKGCSEHDFGNLNDLWKWDGTRWTWMSGSNEPDPYGTYGTKGVAAPGNMPGGRSGSVSWTDASGNSWVFGGRGRASTTGGHLNDLWKWNGTRWTWVSGSNQASAFGVYGTKGLPGPTNAPGAREFSVSWTDASGNLWLFGGWGNAPTAEGHFNDLWRWDGTSWTWMSGSDGLNQLGMYGTRAVAGPENVPGARERSTAWTDAGGGLWLFGGYGYAATLDNWQGQLNDLWKWDGMNWAWVGGSDVVDQVGEYGIKGVADPASVPGAREFSISWTDAAGNLWLFGGAGTDSGGLSGWLNDLWVFGPYCAYPAPPTAGNGGPYGLGAMIRLTATSVAGATYLWTGPNGYVSTEQNPTIPNARVTMSGAYGVTATVEGCTSAVGTTTVVVLLPQTLTVMKVGGGTGLVVSSPGGLYCGNTCAAQFPGASRVTLSATADGTSRFEGWSGEGCTGTDSCTVTIDAAKSVSATFLPTGGAGFHTVTPCRIVDTRNPAGPYGGPALAAGTARAFTIAGQCGVPADAVAATLNVTVTSPTSAGDLTVYPGTGAVPVTSTVSFAAGRTRANNATIGLVDGILSVFDHQATGTTHVIVDVSGYYR